MRLSLNPVCADVEPPPYISCPPGVSGGGRSSLSLQSVSLDDACRGRGHTATVNTQMRELIRVFLSFYSIGPS